MEVPAYQGKLDALCGMYAICNALELCRAIVGREEFEDAWDTACKAIPARSLHTVLRKGTTFSELKSMLRRVCSSLPAERRPEVSYPFEKKDGVTHTQFRREIESAFRERGADCAVIRLNFPHDHWLVGELKGSRIEFTDSLKLTDKGKPYRKNLSALASGRRRASDSKWVVDRREFIILRNSGGD